MDSLPGTLPRRLRRQLCGAFDKEAEAVLIGEGRRQGDFDKREANGVELCVAPERVLGCEAAQGVQQPVGGGMDEEPELVYLGAAAGGAVGSKVELVSFDQILGLASCAIELVVEPARRAGDVGDDKAAVCALR